MNRRIVVAKQDRTLGLLLGEQLERSYAIALGSNSTADKCAEGDDATPLGEFYICAKNPRSKFFLSLLISYPNEEHAERGLGAGLIGAAEYALIQTAIRAGKTPPQHTRLGGEICIHGRGSDGVGSGAAKDWTRGCIALDNADMQDLYDRVAVGTAVSIHP